MAQQMQNTLISIKSDFQALKENVTCEIGQLEMEYKQIQLKVINAIQHQKQEWKRKMDHKLLTVQHKKSHVLELRKQEERYNNKDDADSNKRILEIQQQMQDRTSILEKLESDIRSEKSIQSDIKNTLRTIKDEYDHGVLKQIDCTNRTSATNDKENVLGKRSENFQKDDTLAKQNFVPKSILKKHKTKRDELKTVRFTLPLPVVLDVAHRRSARVQAQKSRSIAHLRSKTVVPLKITRGGVVEPSKPLRVYPRKRKTVVKALGPAARVLQRNATSGSNLKGLPTRVASGKMKKPLWR